MASATTPPPTTSVLPLDRLFENPVFAGGLGIAGLGAAAAFARRFSIQAFTLLRRRLLVNLEISKQDTSYGPILAWLTLHRSPPGFVTSKLTRLHDLSMKSVVRGGEGGRGRHTRFMIQPGYGRHIIRHKNAFISVERQKQSTSNMNTGEPFETITLTTLYAHRMIFEDIFFEAHQLAQAEQEGKTVRYVCRGFEWVRFGDARTKRPLHSVILDKGVKERIVDDVKDFLGRQQWYMDRGVPYRRGYLLHGPPGTGKSSFIEALAGELDYGIAVVNLSENGMTDDRLALMLGKLPQKTLLLLEDADAAFSNRQAKSADGYSGSRVTFSGLLNALDGIIAGEERLAFMTTNHIQVLDEALIRPGRVDLIVRIGEATRFQAAEMWDRFYEHLDANGVGREKFLNKLADMGLVAGADGRVKSLAELPEDILGQSKPRRLYTSAAELQGLFLKNKDDVDGAIRMASIDTLVPGERESGREIIH